MYFLAKDCPQELVNLFKFVNGLLNLIKIAVPILLLVVGSLDLGKAVVAGEEKEIKTAQGMLVKRLIAAISVFFVGTLIVVIMRLINPTWESCIDANLINNINVLVQR